MNRRKFFSELENEITALIVRRSIEQDSDDSLIYNNEQIGYVFFKTSLEEKYDREFFVILEEISVEVVNQLGEPYKRINEEINEIMFNKLYKKL